MLLVLVLFSLLWTLNQGLEIHECTNMFMELPIMRYRAANEAKSSIKAEVMSNELRVLEEYQFNCSFTNITSLVLGIDVERNSDTRDLVPSVRIFRRNSNDPNQYYAVAGSERFIYYSLSNVSTNGVFEYPLNPPIPVMSGDLLAVAQPEKKESRVKVYYIDEINFLSTCIKKISNDQYQIDLSSSPITDELILVYPVTDGYCVNSINSINASVIKEYFLLSQITKTIRSGLQILFSQMTFTCNGFISKWIYGAIPVEGNNSSTVPWPEFQVWRLSSSLYTKKGFSLVDIKKSTMIGTNLYELTLKAPLQFKEGDIFGIFTSDKLSLLVQKDNGPRNKFISVIGRSLSKVSSWMLSNRNNNFPLVTPVISVSGRNSVSSNSFYSISRSIGTTYTSIAVSRTSGSSKISKSKTVEKSITPSLLTSTTSTTQPTSSGQHHTNVLVAVLITIALISVILIAILGFCIIILRRMKKRNLKPVARKEENESPYYITIVEQQNTQQNLPLPSPPESTSDDEQYYSYIQSNLARESLEREIAAETDPNYEKVPPVDLSRSVGEVFQITDSLNDNDYV